MSTGSRERVPALDGLRGLAILLVVPHNADLLAGAAPHGAGYALKELFLFGWAGVQLFFVLSGFLITGILLDSCQHRGYLRRFYSRRTRRIVPLYWCALLLAFGALAPAGLLPPETLATRQHQIWLWTFLSNWSDPLGWSVVGFTHFWSLAIEQQFYLCWPWLIRGAGAGRVLRIAGIACLAALAVRLILRHLGAAPDMVYEYTFCRMDALAMGAAAAALLRQTGLSDRVCARAGMLPWMALVLLLSGAVLTHAYHADSWQTQTFGFTILGMVATLLVLHAAIAHGNGHGAWTSLLALRPLRSFGRYSYAIYIFHFPLNRILLRCFRPPPPEAITTTYAAGWAMGLLAASYCLARISWRLLERPFLEGKAGFVLMPTVRSE